MKENKYDEPEFFEKYGQMTRSRQGLRGAAEWGAFEKLLPDFSQKTVLDLGCGYGWHCRYAAEHGAAAVLGTDISHRMLEKALCTNAHKAVEYRLSAMEDLDFEPETFDIVFSSLAFHYVRDYEALVGNIARWLKPGGCLLFSVEHPVFTAEGSQQWYRDAQGRILHFPVDNYFCEGERRAVFLGETVIKYHRTLTTYLGALADNGLRIERVVEPMPPQERMGDEGMKDELRRPMMLLISAKKPE